MQPSKYSKKNSKTEIQEKPKTASKVFDKPAVLSYEELGGLLDLGLRGYVHNVVYIGLRDKARLISYLYCFLVVWVGDKASRYRRKLPELYPGTIPWLVLIRSV
jgi:hypothetical protein